ncbi:hypothetical protein [Helicobacter sp. 11S02629-2]|uniref:hypothetical protein n=1 Tax=Helicobacter sp. 11S02629-2 TaxID=1476195 RepID=UPI000BA6C3C8|nr:hypothetical protein [Helicobacter sp. 11S02629-2]PAF43124.1 hypothetical protein BKH40_07370 [Helicobacter sp. 11S02629-2]
MGFFDVLGKIGKGAMNSLEEFNAEFESLKIRFADKNEDELLRILKSGDPKEKVVAHRLLKEKYGYSNKDA